jgi:hypothetical protein
MKMSRAVRFLVETFISTYGCMMAAAWSIYAVFPIVRFLDVEHTITFRRLNRILSEPYFPLQIAVGLLAGGYARYKAKRTFAPLTSIVPILYLCFELYRFHEGVLTASWGISFRHFFGNECRPPQCWDQMLTVGPLYSSLAYYLGAMLQKLTLDEMR